MGTGVANNDDSDSDGNAESNMLLIEVTVWLAMIVTPE